MSSGGIRLGQWSGSDATEALHETMRAFIESSARSSKRMLQLTWAIATLTLVMLVSVIVQLWIAVEATR
jgi:hypothetical protein